MKTRRSLNFLALLCLLYTFSISVQAENKLSVDEQNDGWQLLFDGSDLAHWRSYQRPSVNSQWVVQDGAIVLTGKGGGDLISRKQYRDFDLKLDWKISEAGNSGIFILADESAKPIFINAPEIQLLDNEKHPDNKKDNHLSGSLYDMIASPPLSHKTAGEWNQLRIHLFNNKLRVWQNNILTVDITIGDPNWQQRLSLSKFSGWSGFGKNERGHIGFQDHGDPVSFKNIRIKSL